MHRSGPITSMSEKSIDCPFKGTRMSRARLAKTGACLAEDSDASQDVVDNVQNLETIDTALHLDKTIVQLEETFSRSQKPGQKSPEANETPSPRGTPSDGG